MRPQIHAPFRFTQPRAVCTLLEQHVPQAGPGTAATGSHGTRSMSKWVLDSNLVGKHGNGTAALRRVIESDIARKTSKGKTKDYNYYENY